MEFVSPSVCWSYQSTTAEAVSVATPTPPEFTKVIESDAATDAPITPSAYSTAVNVEVASSTLPKTLRSTLLLAVSTPVTIPLRNPVNEDVVPSVPGIVTPERVTLNPLPTEIVAAEATVTV